MSVVQVEVRARLGEFDLDVAFRSDAAVTAIVGPSGAGKTLTLRSIAGLLRPDEGRISVGDRVLFDRSAGVDLAPRDRRIGYCFQQYALFPHLDVAANVAYGLWEVSATEREARVADLLDLVGLSAHRHARPATLSGGQSQRVALARALAPRPEILLLDEPLAAVDTMERRRLRQALGEVRARAGVPTLLVTHDLADAALAQRVIRLEAGRVAAEGGLEVLAGME